MFRELIYKFSFCLILFSSVYSHAQWYPQNSNSTSHLSSIFFINQSTGWACALETILKTTDSGVSWSSMFLAGNHKSIHFIDINNGWLCGQNGKLFKSTDGGENWTQVNSSVTVSLNQITFLNQNFGVIAGSERTILRTTNAGLEWQSLLSSNIYLNLYSVKILSNEVIMVSGAESSIFRTENSGDTWDSLSFGMPNPLLTIEFINQNTGWVSGCCGMFLKTTNAGLNWTPEVYLTPGYTLYSIKFVNENLGWAAGDAGYIFRTTNGGNNWDSLNSGTPHSLYSIHFLNKDTCFIAGYNGLILKTTNGGGEGFPIGINQLSNEIPQAFYLYQNFPNPFNPNTIINYELRITNHVLLKVYDVLGKEIAVLVSEKQNAGSYEVEWNAENFPSGIYYYTLKSGNQADTKKMLLIR